MRDDIKKEIVTIPNLLSLFRILLIPIYVGIYLHAKEPKDYILSAVILAVSALTDMMDGLIARRCHMISRVGKILDPLADKATQGILMICLAIRYPEIWYMFGLFLIKEGFMIIVGFINMRRGRMLKGALFAGKVCTTVLFLALIVLIVYPDMPPRTLHILMAVCIAFMLFSFSMYFAAYFDKKDKFEAIDGRIVKKEETEEETR
jgi:cardiolipin synthase